MSYLEPEREVARRPFILFRITQWVIVGFCLLFILILAVDLEKLDLPGAPITLFWVAMGSTLVVALLHWPAIFFKLPLKAKWAAWCGFVLVFFVSLAALGEIQAAFEKTPEGAKEKVEREALADAEAKWDAARLAATERAEEVEERRVAEADRRAKLERCFSWRGRVSALEDSVKEGLHNPGAFEHVETRIIGPTPDGDNVQMDFRAENAFGALRTGWVRAKLNPDTCELETVGDLTTYD